MLVECNDCGAIVDGIVVTSYDHEENGVEGTYTFLKCPKCEGPFVMLYVFDEDPFGSPQKIYPSTMGLGPAVPGLSNWHTTRLERVSEPRRIPQPQ